MTLALFPGMDPYFEEPTRWPGVHTRLITIIADTLAPLVAPQFIVAIKERVYIASPDDVVIYGAIRPDVHIVRNDPDAQPGTATLAMFSTDDDHGAWRRADTRAILGGA